VQALDTQSVLMPLLQAVQQRPVATLAAAGDERAQLTRVLRDALQQLGHRLQYGQILLATVGATAPFVGLLGTVWGIYLALTTLAASGQMAMDQITGPVGEALIMTAAGLAVALPAVLAYNVMSRRIGQLEAELEGFAHDLRELLLAPKAGA
jgi:biopolymer transport protein ExbB